MICVRKFLFFFVNWLFTVGDECVELRDLFLRFVFYVLLISFTCAGTKLLERMLTKWIDGRVDVVILWMEGTCGRA